MKNLVFLAAFAVCYLRLGSHLSAQSVRCGGSTYVGVRTNLASAQGTNYFADATAIYNYCNGYLAASPILLTSIADGQVLKWDAANTRWVNTTLTGSLPSGTDKQTLRYNGTTLTANSVLTNDGTSIGINTAPITTHKLVVNGATRSLGQFSTIGAGAISSTGASAILFQNTTSGTGTTWFMGEQDAGNFYLAPTGGSAITITSGGDVTMLNKLSVNTLGTATSTNTILCINSSNQLSPVAPGPGISFASGTLNTSTTRYTCGTTSGEVNTYNSGTVTATVSASGTGITFGVTGSSAPYTYKFVIPSGVTLYGFRIYTSVTFAGSTHNLAFDFDPGIADNQSAATLNLPSIYGIVAATTNPYCFASGQTAAATGPLKTTLFNIGVNDTPTAHPGDFTLQFSNPGTTLPGANIIFGQFTF